MKTNHGTPAQRKFFQVTYRLAQQSIESLTLWSDLADLYSKNLARHFDLITTNEDLLRLIGTNAKRSTIVTLFILIDNMGHGKNGHNIYRLAEMCHGLRELTKEALIEPLESDAIKRTIKVVRIVRNNLDAHHADNDEWKKSLKGESRQGLRELIDTIFQPLLRCGNALGIPRLSASALQSATRNNFKRLLRALEKQIRDKDVGQQYISVEQWEQSAEEEGS